MAAPEMTHEVRIDPLDRSTTCPAGQSILESCLREDIWLPHSCTQGTCGSCKVKVLSGEVDHRESSEYTLTPAERESRDRPGLPGHADVRAGAGTRRAGRPRRRGAAPSAARPHRDRGGARRHRPGHPAAGRRARRTDVLQPRAVRRDPSSGNGFGAAVLDGQPAVGDLAPGVPRPAHARRDRHRRLDVRRLGGGGARRAQGAARGLRNARGAGGTGDPHRRGHRAGAAEVDRAARAGPRPRTGTAPLPRWSEQAGPTTSSSSRTWPASTRTSGTGRACPKRTGRVRPGS